MTVTLMLLPTAWGVYELITVVTDAGQQIVSSLADNSMPAWLSIVAVLLAANVLKLPVSELVQNSKTKTPWLFAAILLTATPVGALVCSWFFVWFTILQTTSKADKFRTPKRVLLRRVNFGLCVLWCGVALCLSVVSHPLGCQCFGVGVFVEV